MDSKISTLRQFQPSDFKESVPYYLKTFTFTQFAIADEMRKCPKKFLKIY